MLGLCIKKGNAIDACASIFHVKDIAFISIPIQNRMPQLTFGHFAR